MGGKRLGWSEHLGDEGRREVEAVMREEGEASGGWEQTGADGLAAGGRWD